jgi:signal peptidase I
VSETESQSPNPTQTEPVSHAPQTDSEQDHTERRSSGDGDGGGARSSSWWRAAWDWARPLIVLLVILSSFRSAVADWNDVPTGSMKPTILEGDRVFVNKVAYDLKFPFTTIHLAQWDDPSRGDVVVLKSPENGRRLIKRVIGVPGDVLALNRNRLYVNGQQALYEPIDPDIAGRIDQDQDPFRRMIAWEGIGPERHPIMVTPALHSRRGDFGPVIVPQGQYFVMGDNRDESRDSRVIGYVPRDLILGRAVGVAFSLDREELEFRSGRFFEALE